jgi:hypothetical protein
MPLEEMRMLLGEGIVGKLRVTHKRQQITPAMRFTCTGWITKWIIGVACIVTRFIQSYNYGGAVETEVAV